VESGRSRSAYGFFTFHLPRPASGPVPFHLVRPPGLGTTGFVGDWLRGVLGKRWRMLHKVFTPLPKYCFCPTL